MSNHPEPNAVHPEGLETDGKALLEGTFADKLKSIFDEVMTSVTGNTDEDLPPVNLNDLKAEITRQKPAEFGFIDVYSTLTDSTTVAPPPIPDSNMPSDSTDTDTPTDSTDADEPIPPPPPVKYKWIPERNGNLWYRTRREAENRLERLARQGVCEDGTCQIQQFRPYGSWWRRGYRVLLRVVDDGTGTPGVPPPPKTGVEVHVNLTIPQQVKLFWEDENKQDLVFEASAGEVTEELIGDTLYPITKRADPLLKLGRWGLLYFALFKLDRGIGFHSNLANPLRKTLCDEGAETYCEPEEELYDRVKWGLVVDGTPRSHGCVRLKHDDAKTLFEAIDRKTKVRVYKEKTWLNPSWMPETPIV